MNEFNNRIDAQRNILRVVNEHNWCAEELFGLSNKAINRWVMVNQLDAGSRLSQLVHAAGRALFFLANKSQEQITEEYRHRSQEVGVLMHQIVIEIKKLS